MKILLTAIFKDDSEYKLIERMLKSYMPYMSGLCVALTGVSGRTQRLKALIKRYHGQYIETNPQTHPEIYLKDETGYIFGNFAAARNACFALASQMQQTEKYEWWTWADADDVLLYGEELENIAEQAAKRDLDAVYFTYWYSVNVHEDGSFTDRDVQIDHLRERLLRPDMFKWISRLHEVTVPKDEAYKAKNSVCSYSPKDGQHIVWVHLTDNKRVDGAMHRNIKILEAQKKEETGSGKDDPRTTFYLAKTYYDLNTDQNDQLALLLLDEYLDKSGWAEERASAWEYIANIRARHNQHPQAIDALHQSVHEFIPRHMPFLLLAREYAAIENWEQSDAALDIAMRMEPPTTRTTIGNPLQIKFLAAGLKYNQALRRQNLEEAIKWLKTRNEIVPEAEDEQMLKDLADMKLMNDAAIWIFNYAKWLKDKGYTEKLRHIMEVLPRELGKEAFSSIIASDYKTPRVWGEKEICYYASWGTEHFEQWSPNSLLKGIGGSETAVIELARRWVALGYKVTVYGDPREDEGEHEGVMYRPWYEMNWNDTFNILILWRSPHLLDHDIKTRRLYYDAHDIEAQTNWTDKRMDRIDKVFFKSQFHRSMLPKLPDGKAVVISNGI